MSFNQNNGLLKISEVAERAGVLTSTIRHYTDLGLLKYATTTDGGHRLYDAQDTLATLSRIKRLSSRGFSLSQIKDELLSAGSKKHIVVVDDEPEIGDFIEALLSGKFPHEIKFAMDGFTAGRILSEYTPDIVILDLMLPGVDGFQVCKQIRSDENLKNVKILAITGYDTPENAKKIIEAGADVYLVKPLEAKPTLKKICELLNVEVPSNG